MIDTQVFSGSVKSGSDRGSDFLEFCGGKINLPTPWKINMEPKNHLFEKEYHLNQTSIIMFKMLIFGGVSKNSGTPKWMVYKGKSY